MQNNLFGDIIHHKKTLRDKYGVIPISVFDCNSPHWQKRKRNWLSLGIKSECGRNATSINISGDKKITSTYDTKNFSPQTLEFQRKFVGNGAISVFDPVLTEVMYNWFCPANGMILDPFAGGSVRGIVAHCLGFKYTGCELRNEQVESNREQAIDILEVNNQPQWYCGDSEKVIPRLTPEYDLLFSCPPYANLEVYSDHPDDLSNMEYKSFRNKYNSIIKESVKKLKPKSYAIFVVGEVRDKQGYYLDFVGETKKYFMDCGLKFYNEIILIGSYARASMVANSYMKNKKIPKVHQNVLIFYKTK